jgi:hypothetical protein
MYNVILMGEDGDYILAGPMTEKEAARYCDRHESNYGEGQRLCIERVYI